MPGPPPIPTHLKLLRGNPGHQKLNRREPQPARGKQCPPPPEFLDDDAKAEWARVGPHLWRLGLLTPIDTSLFAVYCAYYAHWRHAEEAIAAAAAADPATHGLVVATKEGGPRVNPMVKIAGTMAAEMVRVAGLFGMTPASRARIAVADPDPPPSKFHGLIAG
jgi:P27 family predicted phage terminase small subunit